MQSTRRGHDLVYFLFMACAGLMGESRPRNDDVVPMRLAQTMVIDKLAFIDEYTPNPSARDL